MKRTLPALFLVFAIGLTPRPASAKGPTTKITISGGGLSSEIEISDQRVLDLSNVWGGQFIDRSKGSVKEPPRGLSTYEIWFYTKVADKGLTRRYVVYYSPDPSTGEGYIYLPGKGQPWYWTNVSAILREGEDGRWNRVSPIWEQLIKPVIARAEATPVRN